MAGFCGVYGPPKSRLGVKGKGFASCEDLPGTVGFLPEWVAWQFLRVDRGIIRKGSAGFRKLIAKHAQKLVLAFSSPGFSVACQRPVASARVQSGPFQAGLQDRAASSLTGHWLERTEQWGPSLFHPVGPALGSTSWV